MSDNLEPKTYNLKPTESASFIQSPEWLDFLRGEGHQADMVNFYEGEKIMATGLFQKINFAGGSYAECALGPTFLQRVSLAQREIDMEQIVAQAKKIGAKAKVDFVRFIFAEDWSEELAQVLYEHGALQPKVLKHSLVPVDTRWLLTNISEEKFLETMRPKTRYNLKVSWRHRAVVKEIKDKPSWWYPLLSQTAQRDGIKIFSEEHYEKLLALRNIDSKLQTYLFAVEIDGHIASAALCVSYGQTMTYLHGASDYNYRQFMAPFALHFGIWQRVKERGFLYYDLWGTNPSPRELAWRYKAKWEGLSRFKIGFGGLEKNYLGCFDIPINKGKYRFLALVARLWNIF
ncbi:MAG: Methicillin resistance protein [Parcubacteria group bacterium GW2011_GWA2_44_15]|nr:MAG: Methicillin resistance protein [Parcubacteria group bacterium GW2011_GWA2_44_15]